MIISASRRTDIPALYSRWFMEQVRAGFCDVGNPYRPSQVSRVSLLPADVDCIVFWSKNPAPMLRYLPELADRNLRYYFQFTLNGYGPEIERHVPPAQRLISTFRRLSDQVGPQKVVWRYDPIIISRQTNHDYHRRQFTWLAEQLAGYTQRVVVSIFDWYSFLAGRYRHMSMEFQPVSAPENDQAFVLLLRDIAASAGGCGLSIYSCAEQIDLRPLGIMPGSCIDGALIEELFGSKVTRAKDRGQRPFCGCVRSRDIGTYGTCRLDCVYCYANRRRQISATEDTGSPCRNIQR